MPVEQTAERVRTNHERIADRSCLDKGIGDCKCVEKSGARRTDVERKSRFSSQLVFKNTGGAGKRVIRGDRSHDDGIEIFCAHVSVPQGALRGAVSHVSITLAGLQNASLFDSGAGSNPLVAGFDDFLQIRVADDLAGKLRTRPQDDTPPLPSAHSALLKITHALVPPKPKELDSTTFKSAWRA